ncbi:PREDICTED: transmembrane protein 26-like [Nanorana parkeri]|uniref:transmembrane protein 26-like n=1 Tax=Nanorana parkeri TaxID=125878 RepID=UPI0008546DE7|nr:PREDICTED: transmembrane protein 26-like [Nanorana parkeri]
MKSYEAATMKSKCWKILSAIVSRLFFSLHGFLMILLLSAMENNFSYLVLLSIIFLLFFEMIITLRETKKGEWKWFSPMVFIYLCSVIPPIFIMELGLLQFRIGISNVTHHESYLSTLSQVYTEYSNELQAMEEILILVLVIGRWLMPKGYMNREQLCQLLLTYLALGADILDILQLIKETKINTNKPAAVVGLCLFSWAILQFAIVLTQTSAPTFRITSLTEESLSTTDQKRPRITSCCTNEMWSVIITIGMQDGPFLSSGHTTFQASPEHRKLVKETQFKEEGMEREEGEKAGWVTGATGLTES